MVSLHLRKSAAKAGTPPGTLVHTGEQKVDRVGVSVIAYDESRIEERREVSLEEALACCDGPRTIWLNVDGIHDTGIIARIGDHFNIHRLTQEDILHPVQRPKMENFEHYLYIVLPMLRYLPDNGQVVSEQVSLILTPRVLISFQESAGDVFTPVRERLHKNRASIRGAGCDYLAYALVDAIVDQYFVILEQVGAIIDVLEEETIDDPQPKILHRTHELKREVIALRKQIWPLREVIASLSRQETALIDRGTTIFFRDVHDHTIQVIDTIESYRDLLSSLLDLYLSTVSNRMGEVIKTLTIIATIFIPLTFIAGVYGMNFRYMPELEWRWGYGFALGIMAAVVAALIVYFKKKNWI
jgi:magnesium transporter